jgi:hypothetical protein
VDHRGTRWSIQHNQFQESPGSIGAEDEISIRILRDLLDNLGVSKCMLYVLI